MSKDIITADHQESSIQIKAHARLLVLLGIFLILAAGAGISLLTLRGNAQKTTINTIPSANHNVSPSPSASTVTSANTSDSQLNSDVNTLNSQLNSIDQGLNSTNSAMSDQQTNLNSN